MRITLHQLNVIKKIASNQSITKTAVELHITQPAVSNIIKQVEAIYGDKIIKKIDRKIQMTDIGQRIVDAAQKVETIIQDMEIDISGIKEGISGEISVAIVSTAKYFFPKMLGAFCEHYPDVKVKLIVGNRQEIIRLINSNACDFFIMSQPPSHAFISKEFFYNDQLVIAASPEFTSKQNSKPPLKLNALSDEKWIIREQGSGTKMMMDKLFKDHKMTANIFMEIGNNESIKRLIMANMGISMISYESIKLELENKLIQIFDVVDFPVDHPWYIVTNNRQKHTKLVELFYEFSRNHHYDG
ncbi:LysR family transcriptional regulator [Cysteiniphilum halobium]|uniref:LysR family transcriptional regulator n=1 Tax=Cysteiniphilum halobium TaxID=2219059 RepID=UPI000E65C370|nr:LysR family transcriptional regulator [Cysteiniphilum halobium]